MYTTDGNNQQSGGAVSTPQPTNQQAADNSYAGSVRRLNTQFEASQVASYRLDLQKVLPAPKAVLTLGDSCIASRGNLSAVVGEAKSKKTFLASGLVASLLQLRKQTARPFPMMQREDYFFEQVIWVDTEQSEYHARKVADRITRMSGYPVTEQRPNDPRITYFTLRELPPDDRLRMVTEAIELLHPTLIVLDGVADLQRNTNDLEESDALIGKLMALSSNFDCHILCILHTNPGSDKARGHLGSSLQRKAETVLYVHKVGEMSLVEPQFCRNEPFERFAFMIDEEGLPTVCDLPQENNATSEVERILRDYYGGAVERSVLTTRLSELCGLDRHTATMRISRAIKRGQLCTHDKMVCLPDHTTTDSPAPAD